MTFEKYFIGAAIILLSFILLGSAYIDIGQRTNFDGYDSDISTSLNNYSNSLNNAQNESKSILDNSKTIGVGSIFEGIKDGLDIIGSLIQNTYQSIIQSVSFAERTTDIIEDAKKQTSGFIPVEFWAVLGLAALVILAFLLFRWIAGR